MAEREILFRGKAINRDEGYHRTNYKNGDWVYGLVTRLYDERFESLPAEMTDVNGVSGIEVDYRTIGQYTGLTDKNGVKIFEWDIVKAFDCIYVVMWDSAKALFYLRDPVSRVSSDFYNYFGSDLTVIGNIHDNPEMLGNASPSDVADIAQNVLKPATPENFELMPG